MRSIARLLPLSLLTLPFIACSSDKNHAERDDAAKRDPSYTAPFDFNKDPLSLEADMKAACIGQCKPDPGSKPVDITKAEAGYQFAWMWDLDPQGGEGRAWSTYTYDDNTTDFVVPRRQLSATGNGWGGWEPPGEAVPPGQGPAWAVRFKGGPFTEYGGGFGQSLRTTTNNPMTRLSSKVVAALTLLEAAPSKEFPDATSGAYDLRGWEGLAIWVRRGPDGQSTMRMGITERNSAEDLNSEALAKTGATGVFEGKYCRRWRNCGCSGDTPCTLFPGTDQYRCFDPALETPDLADPILQIKYPHCGVSRCDLDTNSSTALADPSFAGKSCNKAVTSDGHSDSFCFDPDKDPTPPAKRERCNNPFSRAFNVSTDWQLVRIPFKDLRQADEADVAPEQDLSSVKQLVVTYGGGWIDFWVANIGFYRKQ